MVFVGICTGHVQTWLSMRVRSKQLQRCCLIWQSQSVT